MGHYLGGGVTGDTRSLDYGPYSQQRWLKQYRCACGMLVDAIYGWNYGSLA